MGIRLNKVLVCLVLVLVALISCLLLADRFGSSEHNQGIIRYADDKIKTILELTATSTLASAGLSAIPGDTATPIAEKLTDLTGYFLLILSVLYSEKYLLPLIGAGVFKYLIPGACAVGIFGYLSKSEYLSRIAVRCVAFGVAVYLLIPISVAISNSIEVTYRDSINATINFAEEITSETDSLAEADDGDRNDGSGVLNFVSGATEALTKKAAVMLNRFIETLAVMIVTTCVIPLLVLASFIMLFRRLTSLDPRVVIHKNQDVSIENQTIS